MFSQRKLTIFLNQVPSCIGAHLLLVLGQDSEREWTLVHSHELDSPRAHVHLLCLSRSTLPNTQTNKYFHNDRANIPNGHRHIHKRQNLYAQNAWPAMFRNWWKHIILIHHVRFLLYVLLPFFLPRIPQKNNEKALRLQGQTHKRPLNSHDKWQVEKRIRHHLTNFFSTLYEHFLRIFTIQCWFSWNYKLIKIWFFATWDVFLILI